jgi:hypothetical protein
MIDKIDDKERHAKNNQDSAQAAKPFPIWTQAMKHDKPSDDKDHKAKESRHWAIQNRAQSVIAVMSILAFAAASIGIFYSYRAFKAAQRQAIAAEEQFKVARDTEQRSLRRILISLIWPSIAQIVAMPPSLLRLFIS